MPFCVVDLRYDGIVSNLVGGLNLHHVRKHPELYETDHLKNIVGLLPCGVMPVGLPPAPSIWQAQSIAG